MEHFCSNTKRGRGEQLPLEQLMVAVHRGLVRGEITLTKAEGQWVIAPKKGRETDLEELLDEKEKEIESLKAELESLRSAQKKSTLPQEESYTQEPKKSWYLTPETKTDKEPGEVPVQLAALLTMVELGEKVTGLSKEELQELVAAPDLEQSIDIIYDKDIPDTLGQKLRELFNNEQPEW